MLAAGWDLTCSFEVGGIEVGKSQPVVGDSYEEEDKVLVCITVFKLHKKN